MAAEFGGNEPANGKRTLDLGDFEWDNHLLRVEPRNLKLGEQDYPIADGEVDKSNGKNEKKNKVAGTSRPGCQVDGCRADLSHAKDYHRRHKVCKMHSKATGVLVGNVPKRFCQQCSRFHTLEAFDEGKRSCRTRLAGHNKRRRKAHVKGPDLLAELLTLLCEMHANGCEQSKYQDRLSELLKELRFSPDGSNISGTMQGSKGLPDVGTSNGILIKDPSKIQQPFEAAPSTDAQRGLSTTENQCGIQKTASASQPTADTSPAEGSVQVPPVRSRLLVDIDLNHGYNESEDCVGDLEKGDCSAACECGAEQNLPGPPLENGNSASTSGQLSTSGSESECLTAQIVIKLFKDLIDFPDTLRRQIIEWASRAPTDIEGHIRPGCIVLTIYLRLHKSLWEELSYDMSSSLSRLLDASNHPFWRTGWIYTRIRQHAAIICDGRVVLNTPLPFESRRRQISSISPIAVPSTETVKLVVRGSNLCAPTSRLLCAIEGRYLVQESCDSLVEGTEKAVEQDEIQSLSFHCSMPNVFGRGFIEVEDDGLTGCFFPFIVAEPEVCSEICMLERVIEVVGTEEGIHGESDKLDTKSCALNFIHEMGWLLQRNRVRFKPGQTEPHWDPFPFERLKWLVKFSVDHDWCAVVGKLLDFLSCGTVDMGAHASIEHALADMALLHAAVRRNNRPMVEFLLRYVPKRVDSKIVMEHKQLDHGTPRRGLFRPDVVGAGGLTPLHIAASSACSENVLNALLEDPGMVGIEAWKNVRDNTGLTPCDYASLRGHYHYVNLVQRKINQKSSGKHVVLDYASLTSKLVDFSSFYTEKPQVHPNCRLCERKLEYGFRGTTLTYRPAMILLVAIGVVCVSTALLFKSAPDVGICKVFRWETLKYGAM